MSALITAHTHVSSQHVSRSPIHQPSITHIFKDGDTHVEPPVPTARWPIVYWCQEPVFLSRKNTQPSDVVCACADSGYNTGAVRLTLCSLLLRCSARSTASQCLRVPLLPNGLRTRNGALLRARNWKVVMQFGFWGRVFSAAKSVEISGNAFQQ